MSGIVCDSEVSVGECTNLRNWLYDNSFLRGHYPFDKIMDLLETVLQDNIITKEEFERKKKLILKAYVTDFENIEDIEYNISNSLMMDNKIDFNEYSKIDNMNYEEACNIINAITYDNVSIIKTIK